MHLLVNEPENGLLANAPKMMKLPVSLRQRRRPFWQKRYYDANLCSHNQKVDCLRYIHRNPVKRGLVQNPEDWPWSIYRHYATEEQGVVSALILRGQERNLVGSLHFDKQMRKTGQATRCEWVG